MSGLFGFVSSATHDLDAGAVARQIGTRLLHRPFHATHVAQPRPNVAFGRHSIGILNTAPQPVRDDGADVWLWMSGELYHHHELQRAMVRIGQLAPDAGDEAMALAIFLAEGVDGITRLQGAFTIAIWDGRGGELILVNDRHGLYPHYIGHAGGMLVFAPEIKAILQAPEFPRTLDLVAVAQYTRFQQLLGDRTWLEDVKLLAPASVLRYRPREDTLQMTTYWDWDEIGELPTIDFNEGVEEGIRLFQRAVDEMSRPPHRIGVYLSGGLDSRAILGFSRDPSAVTTITYGQPNARDVVYAADIAKRAGSKHVWMPFQDGKWILDYADLHLTLTEGMHSWMHAHGIHTLDTARELFDVSLSGWDGGTTFTALSFTTDHAAERYYRYPSDQAELTRRLLEGFCQHATWPGLTDAEAASLSAGRGDQRIHGLALDSFHAEVRQTEAYRPERRAQYFYMHQHVRRSTQNMIVFGRSAIEVRCPFFDYDLIDFLFALPDEVIADWRYYRSVITRRAPSLAMVPYDHDNRIPHTSRVRHHTHASIQRGRGLINRKVARIFPEYPTLYADYEEYLRTDLREWAESTLFDPRTTARGLFDPDALQALWNRHLSGNELWTIGKIAPFITIELVLRYLLDDDDLSSSSGALHAGQIQVAD